MKNQYKISQTKANVSAAGNYNSFQRNRTVNLAGVLGNRIPQD